MYSLFVALLVRVAPNCRATAALWVLLPVLPANRYGEDPGTSNARAFSCLLARRGCPPLWNCYGGRR